MEQPVLPEDAQAMTFPVDVKALRELLAKATGTYSLRALNNLTEALFRDAPALLDAYERLEAMDDRKIPVIPPLPQEPPFDPDPTVAICGECGLHIKRVMGYYCAHPRCPTGLGGLHVSGVAKEPRNG